VVGRREQVIAQDHRRLVAVQPVHRLAPTPDIGPVEHIVVHQRGHVDHFADGRERDVVARHRVRGGQAAGQHQRRPQHFAAVMLDMLHKPRHRWKV
jgi:hypothetical protein